MSMLKELKIKATKVALAALEVVRSLPKAEGQEMMEAAWETHYTKYLRMMEDLTTGTSSFPEVVALVTLGMYFKHKGDWNAMIADLKKKLVEIEEEG